MIDKRIKILSDYFSDKNNVSWRVLEALNYIIDYCTMLDKNYQDKTVYLERLSSWYIDHILELNLDHIDKVSYEFVKHILLDKLKIILNTPADLNYQSIENNIFSLDISNGNKLQKQGDISQAMKLYIKDIILYNTKDKYETT
mgnify:CR=1 FL=1|tara:strand:+ start:2396 stop:2824 length:429 start_codon:yes stop_codon:yes gene_type:complete